MSNITLVNGTEVRNIHELLDHYEFYLGRTIPSTVRMTAALDASQASNSHSKYKPVSAYAEFVVLDLEEQLDCVIYSLLSLVDEALEIQ